MYIVLHNQKEFWPIESQNRSSIIFFLVLAEPGAGKANVDIKLWGLLRRCCSVVGEGIRRVARSPKYKD